MRGIRRLTGLLGAAVAFSLLLGSCSSSSSPSITTTPAITSAPASNTSPSPSLDRAAAKAEIIKNWEAFFSKNTPLASKTPYLEKGQAHLAAIRLFGTDPRTNQATAKVVDVAVTTPTTASVSYQILLGSTVELPNATGTAVSEGGVWKVSDATFCGLLGLLGTKSIPGC